MEEAYGGMWRKRGEEGQEKGEVRAKDTGKGKSKGEKKGKGEWERGEWVIGGGRTDRKTNGMGRRESEYRIC